MKGEIWTVKEWAFDKVNDECHNYNLLLIGEYEDRNGTRMLDHTKLRIFDIIKETEKAIKVAVEAETYSGQFREWNTWIPKSAIEKR